MTQHLGNRKRKGKLYLLKVEEDCGESISHMNGTVVKVREHLGSFSYEVEDREGHTEIVFEDELHSIPCDTGYVPDLSPHEKVMALWSHGRVSKGHVYRVEDRNTVGLVSLALFHAESNEWNHIPGWYDPACFRKEEGYHAS
jgi:hypothetical protein